MASSTRVAALRATLSKASAGSIVGTRGITVFIKDELVADGNRPPAVAFPSLSRKGDKRTKARGMASGRCLDREFGDSVNNGAPIVPGGANSRVHAALRAAGIVAIKTQHRVTTRQTMLTTCLDAVGLTVDGKVVCIELKTCQLPSDAYDAYANSVCRRTPQLRCTDTIANTERNRHFIQTGYGAMALATQLGTEVEGVLVVSTADKALLFVCPRKFMRPAIFQRLPTTNSFRAANPTKLKKTSARAGMLLAVIDDTLKLATSRVGFTTKTPAVTRGIYEMTRTNGDTVGAVANAPNWLKMSKPERQVVVVALGRACRKLVSPLPRVCMYVVGPTTHGAKPTLIVVGRPITARRV
jgi:hypothetical protein